MATDTASEAPSKKFVVSVKDTDGDWTTLHAIELRIAGPITLHSDTAGVITINNERKEG